jgi:hypothetical protein
MNDHDELPPGQAAQAGATDPRNTLNDLTGREWTYALRSVFSTRYPTNGQESYAHALRRVHPSPKPPQLMAEIIRFFTRAGGHVLDPFAGVGGTLLACTLENRRGVGVELSPEYAAIYAQICEQLGLAAQTLVVGDARRLVAQVAGIFSRNLLQVYDILRSSTAFHKKHHLHATRIR